MLSARRNKLIKASAGGLSRIRRTYSPPQPNQISSSWFRPTFDDLAPVVRALQKSIPCLACESTTSLESTSVLRFIGRHRVRNPRREWLHRCRRMHKPRSLIALHLFVRRTYTPTPLVYVTTRHGNITHTNTRTHTPHKHTGSVSALDEVLLLGTSDPRPVVYLNIALEPREEFLSVNTVRRSLGRA